MATNNYKKILLLISAVGFLSLFALEFFPTKITPSKAFRLKPADIHDLPTPQISSDDLENRTVIDDVITGDVKPATDQKLKNNQCTLMAIKSSNLNR